MKRSRNAIIDLKQEVTDRIVKAIEDGRMSPGNLWARSQGGGLPINYATKNPYSGTNVLLLWLEAADRGFARNEWMTYKQAQDIGAQVRRGAKHCRLLKVAQRERVDPETGEIEFFPAPVPFSVFNVEEIDGVAPATRYEEFEPVAVAEQILTRSGATIIETGERAFYRMSTDECFLPERTRFESAANFYHVAVHELTHWTAHPERLARDLSGRFGDEAYAFEELVAEFGAAFCLARIGMDAGQLEFHASYLDSWLRVLKKDKNALFTAASRASDAYAYLMKLARISDAASPQMRAAA
ncbi:MULTISPECIES: ArdC family protein [Paraburkholderia]|uniref:Zincin-like metallopeptidase domain-containing protein n=1 Tax=Paraburkholderia madseniana TaxID=2599607 RepID=A0AAP5EZW7_9BURK|nr:MULTISPECIES: zincin-like metallopeptidase domain-containing protein [Paraburkholderia]MCX4150014.1 zincin-like metallopeptidase domain-containing protein [Paraburkholderia madseniana]MCX4177836.1 zincin-like metallopeptidase domain-containing protein [Paraburkholderia madseniana]MDN7152950.1 zincin-like metallopeptidase domain-containing protein [Paraburkholderia sp. WS6]MDQ6411832.1 zincin-like metallopeptidase domain-containing protein [Paraburkholderia madseniana]MDQ6465823.1 zincin-lik